MDGELLTTSEAARRLGLARASLYDWLARSNAGELVIAGYPTAIEHFQSGRAGRGRIRIPANEIDRLLALMRVTPKASPPPRRRPTKVSEFTHIRVPLGRPPE